MSPRAGEQTRTAILEQAARMATVEGLEGLSIGQLAAASGMSKSGLYAHFGSKEELQVATIASARDTFVEEVLRPGLAASPGRGRLLAVCDAFLDHVERGVFPGGCFFSAAAADVGTRRGRVHDAVAEQQAEWLRLLADLTREAQGLGELDSEVDPEQLAFELNALVVAANTAFILQGDDAVLNRARVAVRARLDAPSPGTRPSAGGA